MPWEPKYMKNINYVSLFLFEIVQGRVRFWFFIDSWNWTCKKQKDHFIHRLGLLLPLFLTRGVTLYFCAHRFALLSRPQPQRCEQFDRQNPPPPGGVPVYLCSLFIMFPHQESCVKGPPSMDLYQVLGGGSSYTRFLMREHSPNHFGIVDSTTFGIVAPRPAN